MNGSEHDDHAGTHDVENPIRKTLRQNTTDVKLAAHEPPGQRMIRRVFNRKPDFVDEINTLAGLLFLIPLRRICNIPLRFGMDDHAAAH